MATTTKPDVASIPPKRQEFLKRALTQSGGTVVDKQSLFHYASCTSPTCVRCKFVTFADIWSRKLPLSPDDTIRISSAASKCSWNVPTSRRNRTWLQWREGHGAGCIVCHAAGLCSPMALYTVNTNDGLQLCHMMRHQSLDSHIQAAKAFVEQDEELLAGAGAPSAEAFERMVDQLRKGVSASAGMEGVGEHRRITKMIWCMREAIQDMDRDFLARSTCTTLCRDSPSGATSPGATWCRHVA